jgi:hypothetical protein
VQLKASLARLADHVGSRWTAFLAHTSIIAAMPAGVSLKKASDFGQFVPMIGP